MKKLFKIFEDMKSWDKESAIRNICVSAVLSVALICGTLIFIFLGVSK